MTTPNPHSSNLSTLEGLAKHLGVKAEALDKLRATRNGQAWHFPERSADGELIGTGKRFDDGGKGFVKGGKRGLTMTWPLDTYAGATAADPVLIVEGPSDTAAGLSMGFDTVGRPSATGGLKHLRPLLRDRHAVIVGENDEAGRSGAEKIAAGLVESCASVRIIFPPDGANDLREWYAAPAGCTPQELLSVISAVDPFEPTDDKSIDGDLILDPGDPMPSAREFVARFHSNTDGLRKLVYRSGDFHAWNGSSYPVVNDDLLRAQIYKFLERAHRLDVRGDTEKLVPFKPTKSKVDNVLDALLGETHRAVQPPAWIDGDGPDPADCIATHNGILHVPTRKLKAPTPRFFNTNATEFDYNTDAPTPRAWLQFLGDLWGSDHQAIDALQEMFGLFLTLDTRHEKIFLVVGPKRSGKGTIARVLRALLGPSNICGPTMGGLSNHFGLQPLIGKQLAIISDARFGGKASEQATVAERLLAISGEDALNVPRKNRVDWEGKLSTRFLILTNELPRIADASGALASRFIVLTMQRSFYGQEDHELTDKLIAELPSIFNWALAGLDRLRERGRFVQPDSSAAAIAELDALGSPVSAFIDDCCIVEPGRCIQTAELYKAWRDWCDREGRDHPGTAATFGRDLTAAQPGVKKTRRREYGRIAFYEGINLE